LAAELEVFAAGSADLAKRVVQGLVVAGECACVEVLAQDGAFALAQFAVHVAEAFECFRARFKLTFSGYAFLVAAVVP
jgi:hypothetical protein